MKTEQTHSHVPSTGRAGNMTAVMRAIAAPEGPRVLRIGVVHDGKMVEERVIAQRTHVTVGPSESSTFVLPSDAVSRSFRLFEVEGAGYRLTWLDGMSGRVALETGIHELSALRAKAGRTSVGGAPAYQLAIPDSARGKIVVGTTTFLFQLVGAPPKLAKPQLPSVVRQGTGLDWTTTIVAAFSFLLHFGLVGSIYSDWMDPLLDEEARTAQLVDSLRDLPPPAPVETPAETTSEPTDKSPAPAAEKAAKPATVSAPSGPSKGSAGATPTSDARAAAMSSEMEAMNVEMLAALRTNGGSTERLLSGSDIPLGMLDDAAASNRAVATNGNGTLNMGNSGNGLVRPGENRNGLGDIGNTGRGEARPTQGNAQTTQGPRGGNANVGPAEPRGGSVANASSVVAAMQAGFRRCYNRELPNNPDMKGSVRITAKIGPNGEVMGASASGGGGLSGSLISCVTSRVASATFAAPEGGGATIVIPVSFFPQ